MNLILESNEEGGAIYLGNLEAASNVEYLKLHNIGAVLTVAYGTGLNYNSQDISMHEIINADDALYQDLSQYFKRMIHFIETARKRTNILIHCFAGISRSVTAVIAYVMHALGWTYEHTFSFVRSQRSIANPNPSFVRQLKQFEGQLKAYPRGGITSCSTGKNDKNSRVKLCYSIKPKQVIDDLFNSPIQRTSSSYSTRNLLTSYQNISRSQINTHLTSTPTFNTYQQPLFNPTTSPYYSANNPGISFTKHSSPSSLPKNNLQITRAYPTQQNTNQQYSRLIY